MLLVNNGCYPKCVWIREVIGKFKVYPDGQCRHAPTYETQGETPEWCSVGQFDTFLESLGRGLMSYCQVFLFREASDGHEEVAPGNLRFQGKHSTGFPNFLCPLTSLCAVATASLRAATLKGSSISQIKAVSGYKNRLAERKRK